MSTVRDGISPAPWAFDDNREGNEGMVAIYDADGRLLFNTGDMEDCDFRDIADVRLIAAAPDLYDALVGLVNLKNAIETGERELYFERRAEYEARKEAAWNAARAALAKVEQG